MAKQKSEKTCLIDWDIARGLFSLYNTCYKTGVMDAHDVQDEGRCVEFARDVREPAVYGRVINNYTMNTKEWKLTLLSFSKGCYMKNKCRNYILWLDGKNYYSCALPIAQEFYIRGMEDFNKHPTLHKISAIDTPKMELWTADGLQKRTRVDMLADLQQFCFDRGRMDEASGSKYAFNPKRYEWFSQAIWAAMQSQGKDYVYWVK